MSDQFIDHNHREYKETGQFILFDIKFLHNRTVTFTVSPTNCLILCFQRSQCIKPLTKTLIMLLCMLVCRFICIQSLFYFQMSPHSSKCHPHSWVMCYYSNRNIRKVWFNISHYSPIIWLINSSFTWVCLHYFYICLIFLMYSIYRGCQKEVYIF